MKTARPVPNAIVYYDDLVKLPNDVLVLSIKLSAENYFEEYAALPEALRVNGTILGRSGFNSDTMVAYFRSDKAVAYF